MAQEFCSKCKKLRYRTEPCLGSAPCPLKLRVTEVIATKPTGKPRIDAEHEGSSPMPVGHKSEGRKNLATVHRSAASPAKGLELGDSAPSVGRASDKGSRNATSKEDKPSAPKVPRESRLALSSVTGGESAAPKSKRGRPRIHPDRKAYKAEKERQRRAKLKAEGK